MGLVGVGLAALAAMAYLPFGGVHLPTRAVLHGWLAVLLAACAAFPTKTLARAGVVYRIGGAGALLVLAVLSGLIVLPAPLLHWLAPGVAEAFPQAAWSTMALDPEGVLQEALHLLLVVCTALVVATVAVARWRRGPGEVALFGIVGTVVAVALAHVVSGSTDLFGVVDTWIRPPMRYFAPFLYPNHLAATLLLAVPLAVGFVARPTSTPAQRLGALALLSAIALAILWAKSAGGIVAGLSGAVLGLILARGGRVWWTLPILVLLIPLVWVFDSAEGPQNATSLHGRGVMWSAAASLLRHHWLAGAGGGGFAEAVLPYRTDRAFVTWDHAHNDLLEWVVETGLIGTIALILAAAIASPRPTRSPERAGLLLAGVAAVGVHSLVDFPLQVPAIAMSCAAIVAFVLGVFEDRRDASGQRVRAVLLAFALVSVLGAAWQWRSAVVESASTRLRQDAMADDALETLQRLAPWRHEVLLASSHRARGRGDSAAAVEAAMELATRHSDNADALRAAAVVLLDEGSVDAAAGAAERAVERSPSDWRTWAVVARVSEVAAPATCAERWLDAVSRGAPARFVSRCWRYLPVGLAWVDAVKGLPQQHSASLARELERLGDIDGALLAYEQGLLMNPEIVHVGYPRLLIRAGSLSRAEEVLRHALERSPRDPRFLKPLAELLEVSGRHDEAAELWLTAAERDRTAQARAVGATAMAEGPLAALRLLERLELEHGRSYLTPAARIEKARLLLQSGDGEACMGELIRSELLDDPQHGKVAREVMASCREHR